MSDWLDLPAEHPATTARKQVMAARDVRLAKMAPPPEDSPPAEVPVLAEQARSPHKVERTKFAQSWRALTRRQQKYIEFLVKFGFNKTKALKALKVNGIGLERHMPLRWAARNEQFKLCLDAVKAQAVGDAVEPGNMLLAAHEILEMALEGTPRFRDGQLTGYEPALDTALRANEQKMKATGMLRADQQNTRVTVRVVNLAGPEDEPGEIIDAQAETVE